MTISFAAVVGLIVLAAQADEREYPEWKHLSSKARVTCPLRAPRKEQTGCLVIDVDKDGLNDIA